MTETRPPRRYGQYDRQVILYQAERIPKNKLRYLFDDLQWNFIDIQLKQASNMEQVLFPMGVMPLDLQPKSPRNWKGPSELPTNVFAEEGNAKP